MRTPSEPAVKQKEIVDELDPKVGLKHAVETVWHTCKGCVKEMEPS